jgi:hypothetical protein
MSSGIEGVEAFPESAFEFVGSHGSRLRRRARPRVGVPVRMHSRTLALQVLTVLTDVE